MRSRLACVLAVLFVVMPGVTQAHSRKSQENAVKLRVSPRLIQLFPGHPSSVMLTLRILNITKDDFWCPLIKWVMPDGTSATEEGDCNPTTFEATTAEDRAIQEPRPKFFSLSRVGPGSWTFRVELYHGNRKIAAESVNVEARGVSDDGDSGDDQN